MKIFTVLISLLFLFLFERAGAQTFLSSSYLNSNIHGLGISQGARESYNSYSLKVGFSEREKILFSGYFVYNHLPDVDFKDVQIAPQYGIGADIGYLFWDRLGVYGSFGLLYSQVFIPNRPSSIEDVLYNLFPSPFAGISRNISTFFGGGVSIKITKNIDIFSEYQWQPERKYRDIYDYKIMMFRLGLNYYI